MKKFAIIQSGHVANIVISDEGIDATWVDLTGVVPQPGPGWSYDGTTFTAPPPAPGVVYTKIRASALWARFTNAERIAYNVQMQHNPADTAANQNRSAKLRIFREDVGSDGFADLSSTTTQSKFNGLMVTESILTAPRATTILTTPITADEAA